MTTPIETPPTSNKPIASYVPSEPTLSHLGWQAANFSAVVFITSGLISLIHNPLNVVMLNKMTLGRFFQSTSETNTGFSVLMRHLYTGIGSCFAGTGTRTAYMSGTKKIDQEMKNNSEESPHESERPTNKQKYRVLDRAGYLTAISLGELVVTQVPEVLSQLRKLGIIEQRFKWCTPYNLAKLSITSSGARFCFGFVNFLALSEAEEFYAAHMPLNDLTVKHFCAGAASGMTAAIFSYPFSYYRDYHLSKMHVLNGQLRAPGALKLFSDYVHHTKQVGVKAVAQQSIKDFCIQAPLRMFRTGTRFSLISGVAAICGNEPLNYFFDGKVPATNSQLGFFPKQKKVEAEDTTGPKPGMS